MQESRSSNSVAHSFSEKKKERERERENTPSNSEVSEVSLSYTTSDHWPHDKRQRRAGPSHNQTRPLSCLVTRGPLLFENGVAHSLNCVRGKPATSARRTRGHFILASHCSGELRPSIDHHHGHTAGNQEELNVLSVPLLSFAEFFLAHAVRAKAKLALP